MKNEKKIKKTNPRGLFVKVMAIVLAALMVASVATIVISLLFSVH